jgi:hypothetical protein
MLQEISSPTERLSANAFDTVIDIVLKDLNCLWKTLDRYQTNLFHYFKYCDYLCLYRFCLCCAKCHRKSGSSAMTRSLAVEWGKYGIRSNAIAPGPFPTKGAWDRLLPGDLAEKFDI